MNQRRTKDQLQGQYPPPEDIVIFQPEFDEFGGEERVILALSRELHAQGKQHSVLCYLDQIGLSTYADWPLKVYELHPGNNPFNKVLSLRRCLAYLHRHGSPIPMLFNIQSAYHAGLAVKKPYYLRIPDTYRLLDFKPDGESKKEESFLVSVTKRVSEIIRQFFTGRGIRRSSRFFTNTAALGTEMQQLYYRRAEVIYLGGFSGPRHDRVQRTSAPIELLSVSRLHSSKRVEWTLQALADVKHCGPKYPEWRLHVVGTGPQNDYLRKMSNALGLSESVIFHGFVSDEYLQELYERSHVFLMPAKQGYGLPAIEALYLKMGVVVSEESGVVELLENTNWVSIARNGKAGYITAVKEMLLRVVQPDFFETVLPDLPTELSWAREIINYCCW